MAIERWFWTNIDASAPYTGFVGVLNDRLNKLSGIVRKMAVLADSLPARLTGSATLNFAAPGAVPGSVDLTIAVTGAVIGNRVSVGAPVTVGSAFVLSGFVSATDTVTVRWTQLSGAPANPDGAGGTYTVDVWQ